MQFLQQLLKLPYVTIFCLAGVILRIELSYQAKKNSIFTQNSYFLPNAIGSFIIGAAQIPIFKERYPLIFTGVTIGFCGSLTTFSSWIVGILDKQENKYIAVDIICGIVIPLVCVMIGKESALVLFSPKAPSPNRKNQQGADQQERINEKAISKLSSIEPKPKKQSSPIIQEKQTTYSQMSFANNYKMHQVLVLLIFFVPSIVMLILDQTQPYGNTYIYQVILGPPGAILRFFLGENLNSFVKQFQVGTFLSNLFGSIISFILQVSCINQNICYEVQVGFCGSLSTVSSWANDTLSNFKVNRLRSIGYNLGTLIICGGIGAAIIEPNKY